jgi:hypothetical protein
MSWIRVALFMDAGAAEVVRRSLLEAGIQAKLHHEPAVARLWFVSNRDSGMRVEVPAHQLERATRVLWEWDSATGGLRDAVHCPECASLHVDFPQFTEKSILTNVVMGMASELRLIERDFYCEDCHCLWSKPAKPRRPRAHMAPNYFLEDSE